MVAVDTTRELVIFKAVLVEVNWTSSHPNLKKAVFYEKYSLFLEGYVIDVLA